MFTNHFEDAEAFLQMAARWAQNKTEELSCLNNLGALMWYKHSYDVRAKTQFDIPEAGTSNPTVNAGMFVVNRGKVMVGLEVDKKDTSLESQTVTVTKSSVPTQQATDANAIEYHTALRHAATEALAYWDDAINHALASSSNQSAVKSSMLVIFFIPQVNFLPCLVQASAMCGPTADSGKDGDTSQMLGPDKSMKVVSFETQHNDPMGHVHKLIEDHNEVWTLA
jgi:hypothetical protein